MNGVIVGGWEYVWAAYGITAAVFILYGVSLMNRLKASSSDSLGSSELPGGAGALPPGRSEELQGTRGAHPHD